MQSSNKRSKRGSVSNPIAQDHNPPRPCNSCSIWSDHWNLHLFLECKGRQWLEQKRVRIGKLWVMKLQQQLNFTSSGIVDSDSAKKVIINYDIILISNYNTFPLQHTLTMTKTAEVKSFKVRAVLRLSREVVIEPCDNVGPGQMHFREHLRCTHCCVNVNIVCNNLVVNTYLFPFESQALNLIQINPNLSTNCLHWSKISFSVGALVRLMNSVLNPVWFAHESALQMDNSGMPMPRSVITLCHQETQTLWSLQEPTSRKETMPQVNLGSCPRVPKPVNKLVETFEAKAMSTNQE